LISFFFRSNKGTNHIIYFCRCTLAQRSRMLQCSDKSKIFFAMATKSTKEHEIFFSFGVIYWFSGPATSLMWDTLPKGLPRSNWSFSGQWLGWTLNLWTLNPERLPLLFVGIRNCRNYRPLRILQDKKPANIRNIREWIFHSLLLSTPIGFGFFFDLEREVVRRTTWQGFWAPAKANFSICHDPFRVASIRYPN
jgi:hypothetical protein